MSKREVALEVLKALNEKLEKEYEKVQQKLEKETKKWRIDQLSGEFYALQRAMYMIFEESLAYITNEKGD